jgi:hypothetical protein
MTFLSSAPPTIGHVKAQLSGTLSRRYKPRLSMPESRPAFRPPGWRPLVVSLINRPVTCSVGGL